MLNNPINPKLSNNLALLNTLPRSVEESVLPPCILKWRQKMLWVKPVQESQKSMLPAPQTQSQLVACLARSAIRQVCLDSELGESEIRLWAGACAQANKPVFLRGLSDSNAPIKPGSLLWRVKRVINWSIALLLLLGLSSLLVPLALIVKGSTPSSSIFSRQWCVGQGGKLFQLYQFRTSAETKDPEKTPDSTLVGQWLRQFNLDTLPQLFNVLRGEMSLVGAPPRQLSDVLLIGKNQSSQSAIAQR